ncbi:telomere-protecting terminal protein Tpg [Streptomyces sp. NPDC001270]|uniref:telomere-protecting terminal protein Tpg n=1 Tax=Streptomyces sp. NPDC001270 TaxID=3364554 RepID=UPI0036B30E76
MASRLNSSVYRFVYLLPPWYYFLWNLKIPVSRCPRSRGSFTTSTGLVVDTCARFGFTAAPGTIDDARIRHLTVALPPHRAGRLFDAQDAGAGEQQLRDLAAEALGEVYFRDGGRRASGLEVEFTDVEHLEFDL